MRGKQIRFIFAMSMLVGIFAITALSSAHADESKAAKIARAMRAAPAAISQHATTADVDWTVLRSGSKSAMTRCGCAS